MGRPLYVSRPMNVPMSPSKVPSTGGSSFVGFRHRRSRPPAACAAARPERLVDALVSSARFQSCRTARTLRYPSVGRVPRYHGRRRRPRHRDRIADPVPRRDQGRKAGACPRPRRNGWAGHSGSSFPSRAATAQRSPGFATGCARRPSATDSPRLATSAAPRAWNPRREVRCTRAAAPATVPAQGMAAWPSARRARARSRPAHPAFAVHLIGMLRAGALGVALQAAARACRIGGIESEHARETATDRFRQFVVVDGDAAVRRALFESGCEQEAGHACNVLGARYHRVLLHRHRERRCADETRHHVSTGFFEMRCDDRERIAVEVDPWRIGECATQQRQLEDVPGIELGHERAFGSAPALAPGGEQRRDPGRLHIGDRGMAVMRAQYRVERRGLGQHDVARQSREHLREQRGAAA